MWLVSSRVEGMLAYRSMHVYTDMHVYRSHTNVMLEDEQKAKSEFKYLIYTAVPRQGK